jgi:hypothetical protein
MSDYNGWANYETWNVALWIGNDKTLYRMARSARSYKRFVNVLGLGKGDNTAFQTPDGVAWNDPCLDTDSLDEMIGDL